MNIQECVGKRCLLKLNKGYGGEVQEFKVLEVSPSGNWVKLLSNYGGNKFWRTISDIGFVELLQELESRPVEISGDPNKPYKMVRVVDSGVEV